MPGYVQFVTTGVNAARSPVAHGFLAYCYTSDAQGEHCPGRAPVHHGTRGGDGPPCPHLAGHICRTCRRQDRRARPRV